MASHESGFESYRSCLGHGRPSCTGSLIPCTSGSSIASGMATVTIAAYSMTDWRDETEGCGGHSSTWWFNSTLNFKLWMSLSDSKLTFSKWNVNLIMHYELWRSILKMGIFSVKPGLVIVWHSFSLHYHFCWFLLCFFS